MSSRALWDSASCCHVNATVRSSAINEPGPTRTTRWARARSCSPGWAAKAAPSMASLGTKQITISGVWRNAVQYSFAASAET